MVLDTIVEAQTKVIQALTEAGYQNVKDSLLYGITENEIYPFILVDIDSSDTVNLASGLSTPVNHNLVISVYQKSSMGVKEARLSAAQEFDNIMQILNLSLTEERVEYLDTVMNGIKLCGVTAVLEVGLGESIEYHPLLGITSDPIGAILTIDNHPTNILTPTVIRNARSGVYSALKEGYTYLPQTVDLSDRKDKSVTIISSNRFGKLNAPNIYFDYGTGLLHIDTEYTQCEIRYRLDGGDPNTDYQIWKDNIYIDTSQVRAYVIKEGYEDSDITEYNIEVPFVKIVAEADNLDIISVIQIHPNVNITLTSNSENLLLSLDKTTWSNQVTALSGAYRPIYLKAVETGTYYIYKSSGTIIYLGYAYSSSTALFYRPFSLDYKNIICKCYLYYKTVEGYTYFNQVRAVGLKLFIIGSIPDADCNPLKIHLYPLNYT
mgnify:FL=1